jgi:hypothetical protein
VMNALCAVHGYTSSYMANSLLLGVTSKRRRLADAYPRRYPRYLPRQLRIKFHEG